MSIPSPADAHPTPESAACERNKQPILDLLRTAFARQRRVLEIGSGTGQHAVFFAREMPHLEWLPSDRAEWLPGLRARIAQHGPPNLAPPVELDVTMPAWPVTGVDAVFSANTLHIMGPREVEAFFAGVSRLFAAGAAAAPPPHTLAVYGPFRYRGAFTSASNAEFDAFLRARDPASGIRDFEVVNELAAAQGLALCADHAMPANNQLLVWCNS
ncbi:MAG TPA: DUF938 domain-containing protein [Steroidobacteraceae bacterium]|nr:DUF938 domain-containing protein [Steroidobacteraceae bacterium]HNS26684.1 DUF938 domain-containing protein [Steroidobacteraceae bacterium]